MVLNGKSLLEYPVNADVPILGPILSLLNIDYFPDDVIGNIATLSVQILVKIANFSNREIIRKYLFAEISTPTFRYLLFLTAFS